MPSPRLNRVPPSGSADHAAREPWQRPPRDSQKRRSARALARYLARRIFHTERQRASLALTTIVRLSLRVCAWRALPVYRDVVNIVQSAFDAVGLSGPEPQANWTDPPHLCTSEPESTRTGHSYSQAPSPHVMCRGTRLTKRGWTTWSRVWVLHLLWRDVRPAPLLPLCVLQMPQSAKRSPLSYV